MGDGAVVDADGVVVVVGHVDMVVGAGELVGDGGEVAVVDARPRGFCSNSLGHSCRYRNEVHRTLRVVVAFLECNK